MGRLRRITAALMVFGLATVSGTALLVAQEREVTGPPRGITPKQRVDQDPASDNSAATRTVGSRPGSQDGGIRIGTLSTVSDVTVGLLTPETGGFDDAIWRGSDRRAIETLITQLPDRSASVVLNGLQRRLLLTVAAAPEGITKGTPFVELRLERLLAAGHYRDALALIEQLPALARSIPVAVMHSDTLILSGRAAEACSVAAQLEKGKELAYFLKLRSLCFILNDEAAAADLTIGLLRDQGHNDDLFFGLVTQLTTGAAVDLPSSPIVEPVHLELMARAQRTPKKIDGLSPGILRALASDDRFDLEARLQAAQKAEDVGLMSTDDLAALYDTATFTPEQLASPLSSADTLGPGYGHALLYRAIKTSSTASSSAEILTTAMFNARRQNAYRSIARLYWPVVRGLEPSTTFVGIAEDMARIAILSEAVDRAGQWYGILRQSTDAVPASIVETGVLLAARNLGQSAPGNQQQVDEWLAIAAADPAMLSRLRRELFLLGPAVQSLSSNAELTLLEAPAQEQTVSASPVHRSRLQSAVSAGRKGEALLLSLAMTGGDRLSQIDVDTLLAVRAALASLGLPAESNRFLFEVIMQGQLASG